MEPLQDFRENIFYDVSTWHLPSVLDLEMQRFTSDLPSSWLDGNSSRQAPTGVTTTDSVDQQELSQAVQHRLAGLAFEPFELNAPRLVVLLQRHGAAIRVATEEFSTDKGAESRDWPRGSFVLLRQANTKKWAALVDLAISSGQELGVPVEAIKSSLTPVGPDLGSDTLLEIPRCNPLLLVGEGTSSYSAGNLWHYFDTRMCQASTLVDASRLSSTNLAEFSCIVLPSGSYGEWSAAEVEHLQDYVRQGGTVVAIAAAATWLERNKLIHWQVEQDASKDQFEHEDSPHAFRFADARDQRALESIAGAFFEVDVDATHPLAYGLPDSSVPVFRDHSLRFPLPDNPVSIRRHLSACAGGICQPTQSRAANRNCRGLGRALRGRSFCSVGRQSGFSWLRSIVRKILE